MHVESVKYIRAPRNEKDRSGSALKPRRLVPIPLNGRSADTDLHTRET
jgi:hypothetical protein